METVRVEAVGVGAEDGGVEMELAEGGHDFGVGGDGFGAEGGGVGDGADGGGGVGEAEDFVVGG